MVSEDSGLTFSSICGPPSYFDTHFYVRDSFIYAGDKNGGLWLNTTGIGVPSALAISASSITFQAFDCNTPDTVITFSLFDSCSGTGGHLIEASLSDSSAFRILSGDTPRVIHLDDSLRISYQPNLSTGSKDVANLLLRFKLGWKEFDTTITLFGIGSNKKETVGFALSRPQSSAKAGNTTDIRISPIRTIANKGLNEITFDLTYNGDVLGMPQASTGGAGLTITQGAETRAGKFATFPVTIKGTNMTLDSGQAFANVQFFVYLSDSTSTPIELSNMHLNQTDPDYERCTLSATTDSTRLQVDLLCGDSIIVEYMRGHHLPLRIVSLKPNPAENEVQVELDAAEGGVTMMEIYDELGKRVMRREINFAKGRQKVTISTADLPEGMYSVRLGNVSGRFVKVK
jgi:hypothetical protein